MNAASSVEAVEYPNMRLKMFVTHWKDDWEETIKEFWKFNQNTQNNQQMATIFKAFNFALSKNTPQHVI